MCGRYTLTSSGEDVALLFDLASVPQLPIRYNLAPTQEAAVVRVERPGQPRHLDFLRWGLVPSWAEDPSIGNRMINARAESAADKPAYRWSFRRHRCLVPTSGFYEWQKVGKAKQPYLIRRGDGQPFAFAGLWSRWHNPADPASPPLDTFTILTTDANQRIRSLHDRMPVILSPENFGQWLDPELQDVDRLRELLVPAPEDFLQPVPVSRTVNSPANDTADCIAPLVEDGANPA
jgi:putative SOS response-associated peptidase YedK